MPELRSIQFVRMVARMTKYGHCPNCDSDQEINLLCNEHEIWNPEDTDDAAMALNGLISEAREIMAPLKEGTE